MDGDKRVPGHAGAVLLVCSRCNRTETRAERGGERAGVPPQVRLQPIAWASEAEMTWPAPPAPV